MKNLKLYFFIEIVTIIGIIAYLSVDKGSVIMAAIIGLFGGIGIVHIQNSKNKT